MQYLTTRRIGSPLSRVALLVVVAVAWIGIVPVSAQPPGEKPEPAAFTAPECDGVAWSADYAPAAGSVELPSQRLAPPVAVECPVYRLPPVDTEALIAEDEANASWDKPPRVGIGRPIDEPLSGRWYDTPDGGRLWMAAITAEGAVELRLHIVEMDLSSGAVLYVYSPQEPGRIVGPYAEAGPRQTGEFWAGSTAGDTAYIEYYVPGSEAEDVPFGINELGHMYRDLDDPGGPRSPLDCMVDVACESDWEDVSYAVAKITFYSDDEGGAWYNCSGTLLAAQNGDQTPYFLTGAHCIDEQNEADTLECRWFYQHATCGGSLMTSQYSDDGELLNTSGAMSGADWSLLMVKGVLPAGVFWTGWTATDPSSGVYAAGLHHPDGSWKRYSRGRRYSGGTYWHRIEWDAPGSEGAIYYGSSGSGIFKEDTQQFFGNCSWGSGEAGCDNLDVDIYYGRFSQYYYSISSLLAAGSDDGFEDNDTCANAYTLSEEGPFTDLVVKSVAEDWYRIPLNHNQQLVVQLTFTDAYGNIDVQLYDGCGGSVVDGSGSTTDNEWFSYTNTGDAADFYLRVFLSDDTRNTYTLQLPGYNDQAGPEPNPMTFAVLPACGYYEPTTEIQMQATTATDPTLPITYKFEGALGAHDRVPEWASGTWYTDTGLTPNTQCGYRVQARDGAENTNTFSNWAYTATEIETPESLTGDPIQSESITVTANGTFTNLTEGSSGLLFKWWDPTGDPDVDPPFGQQQVQDTVVTAGGLTPETTYTFRVWGINRNGIQNGSYAEDDFTTIPQGACALLGDVNVDGVVDGLDIAGFVRAKLGQPPVGPENQACADYGGTLQEDIDAFIEDLLDI
ncbi:MAG: hypothetical protein JXQ75_02045 [Phycisphaerae bacterium]|nr:hypothetical protein [Phycisphaerae bacterium]